MLSDAINNIRLAEDEASQRRDYFRSRRRSIQLLDYWLGQVETLMERDDPVVPERLINEIAGFMGKVDPGLHRRMQRNSGRTAPSLLDVLFDAEAKLLPGSPTDAA